MYYYVKILQKGLLVIHNKLPLKRDLAVGATVKHESTSFNISKYQLDEQVEQLLGPEVKCRKILIANVENSFHYLW